MDVWGLNFWLGLGSLGIAVIFFLAHGWPATKKDKQIALILFGADLVSSLVLWIMTIALSRGPASLAVSLMQIKMAFVFIASLILSRWWPQMLKEKITTKILVQKIIAIVIIFIGAILIL